MDFTLAKHPKVTATPHLGASTHEAQSRVAIEIAQQFVDLVQGKQLFGAVSINYFFSFLLQGVLDKIHCKILYSTFPKGYNSCFLLRVHYPQTKYMYINFKFH